MHDGILAGAPSRYLWPAGRPGCCPGQRLHLGSRHLRECTAVGPQLRLHVHVHGCRCAVGWAPTLGTFMAAGRAHTLCTCCCAHTRPVDTLGVRMCVLECVCGCSGCRLHATHADIIMHSFRTALPPTPTPAIPLVTHPGMLSASLTAMPPPTHTHLHSHTPSRHAVCQPHGHGPPPHTHTHTLQACCLPASRAQRAPWASPRWRRTWSR